MLAHTGALLGQSNPTASALMTKADPTTRAFPLIFIGAHPTLAEGTKKDP